MGQSDRIKRLTVQLKHLRPLHSVLCTACPPPVGWEDSDYFSGLSDLHVLFRVCSSTVTAHIPGRAPVDVVFFIRSLQMVHSSMRGSVCFLSGVCEGCSSGGGMVCVWGVQVGLIMHRQQWLQWRRPASDCAMWVLEVLEIERNRHRLKQSASCRFCDSHFPKIWLFSRQDRWTVSLAKHFLDTWRQYFPCYLTVSSNCFFCVHCFDP